MKLSNGKFYEVHDYDEVTGTLSLFIYDRADLYENGMNVMLPDFGEWLSHQDNVDSYSNFYYSASTDGLTQAVSTITAEEDFQENEDHYINQYLKGLL